MVNSDCFHFAKAEMQGPPISSQHRWALRLNGRAACGLPTLSRLSFVLLVRI